MPAIHILDRECVRKISAGEVIEGPASIVRELIDNAIDAGATRIDLHIEDGGLGSIRITDNGTGMGKEDIELCWKEHATSKIQNINDLKHLSSRGFRGEALASIASVSKLTICSKQHTADTLAHAVQVENSYCISSTATAHAPGTTLTVENLFYNVPARKRFLKSAASEERKIRSMIAEKSLPVPNIDIRYYTNNSLKKHYPPASLSGRAAAVMNITPALLHLVEDSGSFFSTTMLLVNPEKTSKQRNGIRLFVNNYCVREYTLLQAVEYAYRDVLPGGIFPLACVFLQIDPSMVDVNVHPAKREVRIRRLDELRHALIQTVRSQVTHFALPTASDVSEQSIQTDIFKEMQGAYQTEKVHQAENSYSAAGKRHYGSPAPNPTKLWNMQKRWQEQEDKTQNADFIYLGQVYDVFLLVLKQEELYLVDQHASHERLLYDRLQKSLSKQPLLIPIDFKVSEDEAQVIEKYRKQYYKMGIEIEQINAQSFRLVAVPEPYLSLLDELLECIRTLRGLHDEFAKKFLAQIACKSAIKARDTLSLSYTYELLSYVFPLEHPRCPHGRPLWIKIGKDELLQRIGRKV